MIGAMVDAAGIDEGRSPVTEPVRLLAMARRLAEGGRAHACHAQRVKAFLENWPPQAAPRCVVPATLPAVRWLPQLQAIAPGFSAAFAAALAAAAPALAWRRSYPLEAVGEAFFDNYAWSELAGLCGPTSSEHLACGVLVLGSGLVYPPHRHEAEEIYLPLAGTAEWRQGRGGWCAHSPGSVIHHASGEMHAMRTGREPLLALYLWRSEDLAQKSRLDSEPV